MAPGAKESAGRPGSARQGLAWRAFEPKLAFGANDYSSTVTTNNLRSFDDPTLDPGPFDLVDPPTSSTTGSSWPC